MSRGDDLKRRFASADFPACRELAPGETHRMTAQYCVIKHG
jgi:hypothetical protein